MTSMRSQSDRQLTVAMIVYPIQTRLLYVMTKIEVKRVYDDPAGTYDGFRIYIDRLWPRGESKEKFHYDLWDKDIAPSTELRKWFHEDPDGRWDDFKARYNKELEMSASADELLCKIKGLSLVTLLYSSRDHEHNNAQVLADYLRSKL